MKTISLSLFALCTISLAQAGEPIVILSLDGTVIARSDPAMETRKHAELRERLVLSVGGRQWKFSEVYALLPKMTKDEARFFDAALTRVFNTSDEAANNECANLNIELGSIIHRFPSL